MRVCVITPWYPDRAHPFAGIFVRQQVDALREAGATVDVEVAMPHPTPPGEDLDSAYDAMDGLAEIDPTLVYGSTPGTSYIPTLTPPRLGYAGRADAFAVALERKRRHLPIDADVVHAHVALPAGHAALQVGDRPVVVTEHFTGLRRQLGQVDAATAYQNVISDVARFATVSGALREVIDDCLGPAASRRVETTPNIVDLRSIPLRSDRSSVGQRWLYVGNISEVKGVKLLLRSFDQYRRRQGDARLTVVGQGPLDDWMAEYVDQHSLGDAVDLVGAVTHDELGPYFDAADVLVHLSAIETFGISTMEAIGAGLPVVNLDNGAALEVWGEIAPICGEIIPPNAGPADVCDAVDRLAQSSRLDPAEARRFVESQYSSSQVAEHLLEVYRRVS